MQNNVAESRARIKKRMRSKINVKVKKQKHKHDSAPLKAEARLYALPDFNRQKVQE